MAVRRLHSDQPATFAFTAENEAWIEATLKKYPQGKQASAVIPLLMRAQEQHQGWLPEPAIRKVADKLGMAYIRVYEIATFYTQFQLAPVGKKAHVQVCGTTPCMLRGAEGLKEVCRKRIHHDQFHLSEDGNFSWEEVECAGACANAPMVQIFADTYEDLTPALLEKVLDGYAKGQKPQPGSQIGRKASAPLGGATTLKEPSLYDGSSVGSWRKRFDEAEAAAKAAAALTATAAAPVAGIAGAAPGVAASANATAAPVSAAPSATGPGSSAAVKPITSAAPIGAIGGTAPASAPAAAGAAGVTAGVAATAAASLLGTGPKAQPHAPVITTNAPGKPAGNASGTTGGASAVGVAPAGPAAAGTGAAKPATAGPGVKPAMLAAPRGGIGDDLKLLWGVGDKLEKKLNEHGIWHFDQIARWTPLECMWIETHIEGMHGRIDRDRWLEQANKLAAGWRPDSNHGRGER